MKFRVLALDYDGTIAEDGKLNDEVRRAIEEVRQRGITVALVTGRILSELQRVMGDLDLVDVVVAENGAVLAYPATSRYKVLGQPPPQEYLVELVRRGIQISFGECVVEADAADAERILPVIREMGLPLVILFNRDRLMVLPQAVSKATGLREALTTLRLSPHNALAIGDAENDFEMLAACEMGVAVAWGSEWLKAVADAVLAGSGPVAVADYIRHITAHTRLPAESGKRHQLMLGTTGDGKALKLAVRGRTVLICGDTKTGKSWVAGLLCEELILQRYSVCVIDPEGDYAALEALPGVIVLGKDERPPRLGEVVHLLRHHDTSVVVDLSTIDYETKSQFIASLLARLAQLRRETGLPHRIVVDEAHYFLHGTDVLRLLDLDLAGYTLVTYRVSQLRKEVLTASACVIVMRLTDEQEIQVLLTLYEVEDKSRWTAILAGLAIDEAVLFPNVEEAKGALCKFKIAPRLTTHVRHRQKYSDVPVADRYAFVFTQNGPPLRARTMKEFAAALSAVSPESLDGYMKRGDFSRWIDDVFGDAIFAARVRELEKQSQLNGVPEARDALLKLIEERYFSDESLACVVA
jgi:hydroxymethylpyrimidine pyrophosphatase-like HAD family hydrolase